MPPRRTTYQSGRVGMVNIPNVDFSQYKAQASVFSDLGSRLDALTSFAIERGSEEAAIRAERDFLQTIEDNPEFVSNFIQASEEERTDYLGNDSFTVYGKKTRKLGIDLIANVLNTEGKLAIKRDMVLADQTDMDPDEFLQRITALGDGIAQPLQNVAPDKYLSTRQDLQGVVGEVYLDYLGKFRDKRTAEETARLSQYTEDAVIAIPMEGDIALNLDNEINRVTQEGLTAGLSDEDIESNVNNLRGNWNKGIKNISISIAKSANNRNARMALLEAVFNKDIDSFISNIQAGDNAYNEAELRQLYQLRNVVEQLEETEAKTLVTDVIQGFFESADKAKNFEAQQNKNTITAFTNEYSILSNAIEENDYSQIPYDTPNDVLNRINEIETILSSTTEGVDALNNVQTDIRQTAKNSTPGIVDYLTNTIDINTSVTEDNLNTLIKRNREQGFLYRKDFADAGLSIDSVQFPRSSTTEDNGDINQKPGDYDVFTIKEKDFTTLKTNLERSRKGNMPNYAERIARMINDPKMISSLQGVSFQDDFLSIDYFTGVDTQSNYQLFQDIMSQLKLAMTSPTFNEEEFFATVPPMIATTYYNNRIAPERTTLMSSIFVSNVMNSQVFLRDQGVRSNLINLAGYTEEQLNSLQAPSYYRGSLIGGTDRIYDLNIAINSSPQTLEEVDSTLTQLIHLRNDILYVEKGRYLDPNSGDIKNIDKKTKAKLFSGLGSLNLAEQNLETMITNLNSLKKFLINHNQNTKIAGGQYGG